ncbi:MAG: AraC family transcriptional regulator [Chloroflexota bacterium]
MKERLVIPNKLNGKVWFSDSPNLEYYHHHEELECNIVCSGRGSYLLNDRRIDLEPHSIVWLFPDQEHLMIDKTDDFTLWVIVIKPWFLKQIISEKQNLVLLERKPQGSFLKHLSHQGFDEIDHICSQAISIKDDSDSYNAILAHLLMACWRAFQKGSDVPLGRQIHPTIQQVLRLINGSESNQNLNQLSNLVGMSPEALSRLFKKQMGITLSNYRNRSRLNRFFLIMENELQPSLHEAALEAGFGSYAQFYRVFKQLMGRSPADFKKSFTSGEKRAYYLE